MSGQTPHDLAIFVYGRLSGTHQGVSIENLGELFRTIYLSSLKREEGTPVTYSLSYVNPNKPDPRPPLGIRDQRWTFTKFRKPLDYNASQLTKLALAADPGCSRLVVYQNRKNVLQIWGLLDQQGGFESLLSHESESGWTPPGAFHVQVLGPGHLVVMDSLTVVAELNGDHLVEDSVNVFDNSVVMRKFRHGFERRIKGISTIMEEYGYHLDPDTKVYAYHYWIKIIRRFLLRARTFGHGGAFLFTDTLDDSRLYPKYGFEYSRIPKLFERLIGYLDIEHQSAKVLREHTSDSPYSIDSKLYRKNTDVKGLYDDAKEAVSGAIAHVASLSRVDGLVLLDYDLKVHGFGYEIIAEGDRKCICYHATHSSPTKGKLRRLDIQRFGTRHRSMVRYCTEDKSSVGFVVSHDGPVRAVSRSSSRLYFWDNIQLTLRLREGKEF